MVTTMESEMGIIFLGSMRVNTHTNLEPVSVSSWTPCKFYYKQLKKRIMFLACCGQLWVWHMFCGQDLWWAIPLHISIDRVGIPIGFQPIIWTFVRHTVSRCLIFPIFEIMWSVCHQDWLLPVPTYGSRWVVLWLLFFRSAPSKFHSKRSTHRGQFPGVPSR